MELVKLIILCLVKLILLGLSKDEALNIASSKFGITVSDLKELIKW